LYIGQFVSIILTVCQFFFQWLDKSEKAIVSGTSSADAGKGKAKSDPNDPVARFDFFFLSVQFCFTHRLENRTSTDYLFEPNVCLDIPGINKNDAIQGAG
jgi:hypothetical protein